MANQDIAFIDSGAGGEEVMVPPQYDTDDYYYDDPVPETLARSKSWMISLSLATILALVVIGDTIGALVNVNNRTHIEFGQGVTLSVPCDQNGITVKPVASYKNDSADRKFLLDSLLISNLSDQCLGRLFQVKFYSLSGPPMVIGYRNSGTDADAVKFLLSRKLNTDSFPGLNWYTYPIATGLTTNNLWTGDPTLCGGDNNSTDVVNFDWGSDNPLPGCPTDNWLTHFQGFINIPGSDDGTTHNVKLTIETYGNSELFLDGSRVISDATTHASLTKAAATLSLRKGQSYLLDYWIFKPSGNSAANLYWDLNSSGNSTGTDAIIPDSAFYTQAEDVIEIAPTEGITDYVITSVSNTTNDRAIKVTFARPVDATLVKFLTLETT